jgi:hypothetical protein
MPSQQTGSPSKGDATVPAATDAALSDALDDGDAALSDALDDGAADPGCQNVLSQTGEDTGFETCSDGTTRRRAAIACPMGAVDPTRQCVGPCCTSDAECAAKASLYGGGADGNLAYCTDIRHLAGVSGCFYGCLTDADCNKGSICECGVVLGLCVPAGCTDGASCGSGLHCVATIKAIQDIDGGACALGEPSGFYCQTAMDQCTTNKDCALGQICQLQGEVRVCGPSCHVGRPFLVVDEVRRAPIAPRADWMAKMPAPGVEGLSERERALLASHWAAAAQMEHASVAAFARFALELLAMGAPADLVRETHTAMGDEFDHARLCFALASAYAGRPVGPGPLAMDGVSPSDDKRAVVHALIREGCIGEAVAAVEAVEMHQAARDPVLRDVLAAIARDEANHAALSWKAFAWILSASNEEERAQFAFDFDRAVAEQQAIANAEIRSSKCDDLEGFGIADARSRGNIRQRTLADVVGPARRECFATSSPGPTRATSSACCLAGPSTDG